MKFKILFLMLAIVISSCGDEFKENEKEIIFPESQLLTYANISGKVTDEAGTLLDGITVDILIDGILFGSTMSIDGFYSFELQEVHETKTILRAHSLDYTPNFILLNVEEGNGNITQDVVIQLLDFTQSFEIPNEINQEVSPDYSFEISQEAFVSGTTNVQITAKHFLFDNQELLGIRTGIDAAGNLFPLAIKELYYLGAYDLSEETVLLNAESNNKIVATTNDEKNIWFFDIKRGHWIPFGILESDNGQIIIESNQFTYFAFISTDCDIDEQPPIALCNNNFTVFEDQDKSIYAKDFDLGSVDNCSDSLNFKIKVLSDICQNGSDIYADSLSLCSVGITPFEFPMRMLVSDEKDNQDSCDFSITLLPSDCDNDFTAPEILLIEDLSVTLRGGGKYRLAAENLDMGSFDNCSDNLVFQIRKMTDPCGTQQDNYSNYIDFCSAEAGSNVTVAVVVIDESANFSEKEVSVFVEAPDCSMDTEGPEVLFITRSVALTDGFLELEADYYDYGSYDNCSETLDFQIRKSTDVCQNGSDVYGSTITFCPEEMGTSVFVYTLVTDQNGNTSMFGNSTAVSSEDCLNDSKAPFLNIKENHVQRLSSETELFAEDLDLGSYDACSDTFSWTIRKLSDSCNNGSAVAGTSIEFCAEEIGTSVEARVTLNDGNGNVSNQTVTIIVLD